ncbi:S-adenosyl-L-methionine-dependent methyltransferase [Aaosphaeria arxii CBS 175.79]|uniref:S-adenosyl-L-methionine-dependent methyltransferase n=1 Tax=Aaosphaeria arxii CBS 175.79 TaxID=1450172 RepID=A0A6A5XII7_9PLEO|nr:S-adenosyl-L-methionine-dependent methyltransferase [Aaosphaeria arxii CBS 175.79]KAF2013068.1 S-adenosyl-L-methionine-dependent methyltransferase [Aaosphaeria arxii CBS 175.79]
MTSFTPKQAIPRDDKLFGIIGANSTLTVAHHELAVIKGTSEYAIENGAVIHDAACGLGPVTEAISAAYPDTSIKLHATDLAPPMAGIYNMFAENKGWPSRAVIMDCEKLEFPDETFTHTFLSFGLPIIDDPIAATKEMYRTLKPGGTAITAFWLSIPHGESAGETRREVWGKDAETQVKPNERHKDPAYNPELLRQGGFTGEVFTKNVPVTLAVKDIDEFATAIWSAIGEPKGGWIQEDEDRWEEAIAAYKKVLSQKPGYKVDAHGKISLESVAQIAIVKKA